MPLDGQPAVDVLFSDRSNAAMPNMPGMLHCTRTSTDNVANDHTHPQDAGEAYTVAT